MRTFPLTNRGLTLTAMVTLVLMAVLVALLAGASPASAQGSAPDTPDQPNGTAVFVGGVDLEWNDVPGADSYDVQFFRNGQWIDLPGDGVEIAFYGAGAIISELDPGSSDWFQVRAGNAHGSSDWSNFRQVGSTNQSTSGKRARPDNVPAGGAPVINGTAQVGESLTADTTGIEDDNGLDRVQFRSQWISNDGSADTDIAGATDSTYTLAAADEGKTIKVRVSFTDRGGYAESLTSTATEMVSFAIQQQIVNSPATGVPTISGTAQVGETLTADTSGIADTDGLTNVTYSYQWVANDGTSDTDMAGATDSTYTLAAADEGKTIKVRVSFTDRGGYAESLTSTATETVSFAVQQQIASSPATGVPTITGTAQVGEILTTDTTGIADADGLTNVSYSYQWIANDGTSDADIAGATDSTYTLAVSDEGKTIKVRVSFTDDAANAESLTSAATVAVAERPNSPATGVPTITGVAQVGKTLTADTSGIADTDGLTNVTFSYQWISNDGTSDTDIAGATGSTYTLAADDEGTTIKVGVSFTDDAGFDETLTSPATVAVEAQVNSVPVSHITVEVTEDTSDPNNVVTIFTVTWSDSDDCSTNYNAYLNIKPGNRPGHETPGSQLHLGSVPFDIVQIAIAVRGVQGPFEGFNVELYCGTDGSGRLVSEIDIHAWQSPPRPFPSTYSSEPPLSALSVSHGTLTPTFNKYNSRYTVPDVANAETRITITATPKTGYAVDFFEASEPYVLIVASFNLGPNGPSSGLSADCRSLGDSLGPLIELTDADSNTPGFQVDLYDGENYVFVSVYPTAYCEPGTGYTLPITRAEGNVSLIRPNRPAVDLPYISPSYPHSPYVGETLNADVSRISDRDGWDESAFNYQWLADDAEITGATGSSYTVTSFELGKTLKVRVTFTDDRGTEESLISVATKVVKLRNREPTGKPIILGTLEVGQTLTADVSGISDANGLTNATFSYEWVNFFGPVRDGEEYTLVDGDAGKSGMWLRVTYTDDAGHEEQLHSDNIGLVAALSDSRATGAPTITGTAQVGETLTADTSGIADADGLSGAIFSYQWIANDGTSDTDITGATDSTYTLVAADEGKTIKVRVSFTDDAANAETMTSTATDTVSVAVQQQIANNPATGAPTITGTAQVGETLTADTLSIADADGLSDAIYSYQWVSNDGTSDTNIAGATNSTYTLVAAAEGKTIKVRVSFTDDAANAESLTSAATETVSFAVQQQIGNSPATGAPSISGTAQVGETLTADTPGISDSDGLANVTISYQWVANDGTSDTDIAGATDSTYTLVANDEGKTIKVRVSLTSAATATVSYAVQQQIANSPATGAPTISGAAQVGETLTADTSGISDSDGLANVTISYQWVANDGTSDTDIAGATDSSYTVVAADEGKIIKVRVSFTDDAANTESLTSAATEPVSFAVQQQIANSPATGAPTITGTAQVGETLTADTTGIADADGLSGATFSYQWVANDGTADTDITGATNSTYALVADDEGKTIKVRVSFTDDVANEESLTSAATGAVAASPPSYITVAVSEDTSDPNNIVTNFTVTWSNSDDCSTSYNAYLNIKPWTRPGHETPGSQLHLGSVAFDGAQITKGLAGVQDSVKGYNVELYCGTDGSGRMVSRVDIPTDSARPSIGIYSSEPPLSALSVSHGTMTPTFNSYTFSYTVPDVANAETRITITATPETGYAVNFFETSGGHVLALSIHSPGAGRPPSGLSADCGRSQADDLGPLIELTDADPDTPGFQVDLYDGDDNYVHVRVYPTAYCDPGIGYTLAITRAEGTISSPRPNRPAVGWPSVVPHRYPCVGCTMNAGVSHISDRDGWDESTFSYQWLADDAEITGATSSSYTVADTELGKTLKVRVSFTDDRGTEETLTSGANDVVKLPYREPTGRPIIRGTAEVGQTLSADVSGISDPNGMTTSTFTFLWVGTSLYGSGVSTDSDEYTLLDPDAGRSFIFLRVTYTDDAGHEEQLDSERLGVVVARPSNNPATGAPSTSGTVQVGETLTADTSSIADADGLTNVSYSYQWVRNDGTSDADILGATNATYTLVSDDEGKTIKVRVSFTDDATNAESLTSVATAAADAAPNNSATGSPSISGTAQVGETLTADTSGIADSDGLANVTYSYQWIRNDGSSDTEITSATDSTYTLVAADQGKTIKVKVIFTDDAGTEEALTSTATASVAAALLPLTVSLENNPATHNGTDVFTFEIRFSEEFPLSFRTLKFHALQVTGGTVKKALRVDDSSDIHWRITVRPDSDGNVTIVLSVTDDCADQGAICTRDGRKLSNSLEFTVVGPGG